MNLNKTIKTNLIKDVIHDQFDDEINSIKFKVSDKVSKHLQAKYGEFSSKALHLAKQHNLTGVLPCHQSAYLDCSVKVYINEASLTLLDGITEIDFTLVNVSRPFVNRDLISDEIEEAKALAIKIQNVERDLQAVLSVVKTVKKLQELTSVFDPFLPKQEGKGMQLIPAEQLLRVNELKTPKKGA